MPVRPAIILQKMKQHSTYQFLTQNQAYMKEMTQKEMASKGGIARAKKLSKKRRIEIASLAGKGNKKKPDLSTGGLDLQAS